MNSRSFLHFFILRIKVIAGLAPIHLYIQKISECYQLRISTLLNNHTIKFLLERKHTENTSFHCLLLENMTDIISFMITGGLTTIEI